MTKTLNDLALALEGAGLLLQVVGDLPATPISDIQYDSRQVQENTLFLCKGAHFSFQYLLDARSQGACAYLSARVYPAASDLPALVVSDIRRALAVTANWFFDAPWQDLHMMGVTGTKGKSTTVSMVKAIFDLAAEKAHEPLCGITSSLMNYDGQVEKASKLTTPENIDLYRHLATARAAGLKHMVIEVSSQALKYDRVGGIHFDDAVFLNISPDHIGPIEHPTFEDYFASKLAIFDRTDRAFINLTSDHLAQLKEAAGRCPEVVTFGGDGADYRADQVQSTDSGLTFRARAGHEAIQVTLPMHGRFNVENALAALALAHRSGISLEICAEALASVKMEGHMAYIHGADLTVVVDYAHNGISFKRVIETVRHDFPQAPVWLLFGAPGDKAESRRPDMGRVASREADYVILTADDPASESVEAINAEIYRAFEKETPVQMISDRAQAIAYAIQEAPAGAVVLLLGKGFEVCQKINGKREPYAGDEQLARAALQSRES